jgi:hypothetical protein
VHNENKSLAIGIFLEIRLFRSAKIRLISKPSPFSRQIRQKFIQNPHSSSGTLIAQKFFPV